MSNTTSLSIVLNGTPETLENVATVTDLLAHLGYLGKRVAVELNGQIVPRSNHEHTQLNNGDQLEIVVAVGGG